MSKLALCIITKGDEELSSLKQAVDSVVDYVDQVVITTNSNKVDKTKDWCKTSGYTYSHLPWSKDFSKQRNYNFSLVNNDIEWILWLDSDDEFVNPQHIPRIIQNAINAKVHAVFLTYWYGCLFKDGKASLDNLLDVEISQNRERFLKKGSITWKSRLHETPVPVEGIDYKYLLYKHSQENDFAILHKGAHWQSNNLAKMERNKELLELQLEDEKENLDPRTMLYLMKIYIMLGEQEWKKCIELGNQYLDKSGWDAERCEAATIMGRAYGKFQDHQSAIEIIHVALTNYPYLPTTYFRLSEAYFNNGQYRLAKHWHDVGLTIPLPKDTAMDNIFEMKQMAVFMGKQLAFQNKDLEKAQDFAHKLYKLDPSPNNESEWNYLRELNALNQNCERADKLIQYLESIDEEKAAYNVLTSLPQAISEQPFAHLLRKRLMPPRKWAHNEICYFASFGGKHFEEWGFSNLETGIGGSETAVLRLSIEWAKKGYHVTVYGDPGEQKGRYEIASGSVTLLPWYYFNHKDNFNVFIQWRSSSMAGKIACKSFLVDLHDMYNPMDINNKVDKIMVKSEYHKNLGGGDKYKVVSNGI